MKDSTIRSRTKFDWRWAIWLLSCGAMTLFVATAVTASQRDGNFLDRSGAAPYTPTRGEWLCVLLNARQSLANSEQMRRGSVVHYLYDRSKPDVILVQVLADEGATKEQIHRRAAHAEIQAREAAKIYGWQDWLQVEHDEQKLTAAFALTGLVH